VSRAPHIVALGGTVRPGSSSEQALRIALDHAQHNGATTRLFGGMELADLPMYSPDGRVRGPVALDLVGELRRADGVIIASPGYHGGISGLVKNALDYAEDLRDDARPYLSDRAVGLIVTAFGWQASVTTLAGLRVVVHALRGWATPYGAALNSSQTRFDGGTCTEPAVISQLHTVADEVLRFADMAARRGERQPV
jgi:FMN reductase